MSIVTQAKPVISIITVNFNDRDGLLLTAQSLVGQSFKEYEWVVVDGGSSDDSVTVAQDHARLQDIVVSEPDDGIYDAMNKGIKLASGQYIVFMNAGDAFYDAQTLSLVANSYGGADKPPAMIFGDGVEVDAEGGELYRKAKTPKHLWYGMFAIHQSVYFLRELIEKNNIDHDLSFKIAADYYFCCLLHKLDRSFIKIERPLCKFDVGGVSSTDPSLGRKETGRARSESGICAYYVRLIAVASQFGMHFAKRHCRGLWLKLKAIGL